jgi:hypothetical protein
MSDETAAGAGEADVLKVYVYGMLAVTGIAIGLVWFVQKKTETYKRDVAAARKALPDLAKDKRSVDMMVNVFEKNQEDIAYNQPLTWFGNIRKQVGIDEASLDLGRWKTPPAEGPGGTSLEERYEIKFRSQVPLTREKIVRYLHQIEKSSTRLRTIELKISRAGKEDALEDDTWTGNAVIGYRRPKIKESRD